MKEKNALIAMLLANAALRIGLLFIVVVIVGLAVYGAFALFWQQMFSI